MVRKGTSPPSCESEVRRLDWPGTRPRAVASELCVPGFRRVCLYRAPSERGAIPAELRCCHCSKRNGRQPLDYVSSRWRPGGPSDDVALVPWLCVTAFRRVCSEQRTYYRGVAATDVPIAARDW